MIDGVKFALPRQLKRLIYYEKVKLHDHYDQESKKWLPVFSYRPLSIYRLAMDIARERNNKDVDLELRKGPGRYSHEVVGQFARKVQTTENAVAEVRETYAEKRLLSNKQNDTF